MPTSEPDHALPARRIRVFSFLLGVLATLLVVGIVAGGWVLRSLVADRNLLVLSDRIDLARIMRSDPETFWSLAPNLRDVEFPPQPSGPPNGFRVNTNALGLRGPEITPKAGRVRILCIGDSTTFGQYVEDDEAWPAQLQAILDPGRTRVDVVNAGLIGATSFQGLSYLIHRGFDLEPDIIVATYGFNDRGNWAGLQDRASLPLLVPQGAAATVLRWLGRDLATPPDADASRVSPGEFLDVLVNMARMADERGAATHFVVWPGPEQLTGSWDTLQPHTYQSLQFEAAARSPGQVVDLRQPLHAAPQPVFADIVHANAHGCRVAAEAIATHLRQHHPELAEFGG